MSARARTAFVARARRRARRDWCGAIALVAATALASGPPASRAAAQTAPAPAPAVVAPSPHPHRVVAYYFHTTYRCASCRAIEAYAREAIESAFAEHLKDGRILWKVVNVEVKGNEHFVKEYRLYTKSVVLVNEVGGRPAQWKNLDKVWQLLRDKPRFQRYVQDEMRAYLTEDS